MLPRVSSVLRSQTPRVAFTMQKSMKFTPVTVQFAKKQLPLFSSRALHSSPIRQNEQKKSSDPSADAMNLVNNYINKLQTASPEQLQHWTAYGLVGAIPVAIVLSPSVLNLPVDLAMGLMIPVHMHIGLRGVAEDYVPRPYLNIGKLLVGLMTLISTIGLLKVNLCGAGITESIKSIWRAPKKQIKAAKQ